MTISGHGGVAYNPRTLEVEAEGSDWVHNKFMTLRPESELTRSHLGTQNKNKNKQTKSIPLEAIRVFALEDSIHNREEHF